MKLDAEQQRCANNFAPQNERVSPTLTKDFLERFGFILSLDIACEMCPEVAANPELKSYYRPAIESTVRGIVDRAWKHVISAPTKDTSKSCVVFIVGGGTGSPLSATLRNLTTTVFKEARCIYDTTSLSLSRVNNLVEECHRHGYATIVLYISQPLAIAAKSFIEESTNAGIIPSGSEFAISHFNAFNTFITLTSRHKRKTSLFSAGIISVTGDEINCNANLRAFRKNEVTLKCAETAFLQTWNLLQAGSSAVTPNSTHKVKPVKTPKAIKTLTQQSVLIAHLLAENLKTNLKATHQRGGPVSIDARDELTAIANSASTVQVASAPHQELSHRRISGSKDLIEHLASLHETTAAGQKEILDNERPQRIAVQEKKTHEHEMETVLIR